MAIRAPRDSEQWPRSARLFTVCIFVKGLLQIEIIILTQKKEARRPHFMREHFGRYISNPPKVSRKILLTHRLAMIQLRPHLRLQR